MNDKIEVKLTVDCYSPVDTCQSATKEDIAFWTYPKNDVVMIQSDNKLYAVDKSSFIGLINFFTLSK